MSTLKKYSQHVRSLWRQAGFSPRADWAIALGVFALLLVFIAVSSTLVFVQLSTESMDEPVAEETQIKTIDRDKLKETARYFEERAVSASPLDVVLVDPSR